MNLVTPLNRVLGLGSAKDGTEHWWGQRVSAVALAVLGVWLVAGLAGLDSFDYAAVSAWMRAPFNSVMLLLTVLTLCYHSHLGIQMVVEDYVHAPGLKLVTLIGSTFAHWAMAAAGAFAVLKVAFGTAA